MLGLMTSSQFIFGADATGTQSAPQGGQPSTATGDKPVTVLLPAAGASPIPANACWVQIFEDANYGGDSIVVAGPQEIPNTRGLGGYQFGTLGDSIIAGPRTNAMLYEDENYTGKAVKVGTSQRIDEVSWKFGAFESMESLKVACSGQQRSGG
jgi:hypothetical protein